MQLSGDYIALGMHQADVRRAEQEIERRMAAERGSGDAGASSEPVAGRRAHGRMHAPRLALR